MNPALSNKTGIYIAYPTSPLFKSIYRPKKYKTQVNDQHTKVGQARDSFRARERGYLHNFDDEVVFKPIAIIDLKHLKVAEKHILAALRIHFRRSGFAREWFQTADRKKIRTIIRQTLIENDIEHVLIG